jgi:hypothetical protein
MSSLDRIAQMRVYAMSVPAAGGGGPMKRISAFALLFLVACASATQHNVHAHRARSYEPLAGIEVKAKAVESLPPDHDFQRWSVSTAKGDFTISIANDPDGARRKALLADIAKYWRSKSPDYIANFRSLPADKSVVEYKTHYLLYSIEGSAATIHDGHELVRITGDSPRAVTDFIHDSVAFDVGGEKVIEIVLEPYLPMRLLAGYESGEIR